jgi:histidinol-phosphate/aromatic aminotransferase/cobyric acid decarboxylase-like protein
VSGEVPTGPHGGDGARLARVLGVGADDVLDLSMSLNPVAPDARAVVARHLDAVGRYPDPEAAALALAAAFGVDAARVVVTNGGSEAIALVAAEVGAGWVEEPEFSLYRRHLTTITPDAPAWRSNPNNPSGLLAPPDARAGVWDEAFYPLATGTWTRGDADTGAIVVGSLTKVLACPGLRAGYVLAPTAEVAARVRARQPEWSLNGLAAAAVPDLLDVADLPTWRDRIVTLRAELVGVLHDYGLRPEPSDVNWVLVPEAAGLREALAAHGVLVRDCTSFGLRDHVRIAVPDETGLARLAKTLAATH